MLKIEYMPESVDKTTSSRALRFAAASSKQQDSLGRSCARRY
ncbi:hypothetical protein [Burkholderia latens]|nr:hypothetical protein [Burkholderia latens]